MEVTTAVSTDQKTTRPGDQKTGRSSNQKTNRSGSRSGDQKTRKPGKEKSGWVKFGHYLSPEAANRLLLVSIKRKKDGSDLLNALVLSHLPALAITTVASNDRKDPADDVSSEEQEAA